METETQGRTPVVARVQREADVVVRNGGGLFVFEPLTLRAQAWLARNVPQDYHDDGTVVVRSLKAAYLALLMAEDGMVVL